MMKFSRLSIIIIGIINLLPIIITTSYAITQEQSLQQIIRKGPVLIEAGGWTTRQEKNKLRKEWIQKSAPLSTDAEPPANLTTEEKEYWNQLRKERNLPIATLPTTAPPTPTPEPVPMHVSVPLPAPLPTTAPKSTTPEPVPAQVSVPLPVSPPTPSPAVPAPTTIQQLPTPVPAAPEKKEDIKKIRAEFVEFQKNINPDQIGSPKAFATNAMVILLDDSEKDRMYTIGYILIQAIVQKACPILVSASLLANHLVQRYKLPIEESHAGACTKILKELNTVPIDENKVRKQFNQFQGSKTEQEKFWLCAFEPEFNPDDWIIRKPNQFLYLLIPKNYKPEGVSGYTPSPTQLSAAQPLTEAELKLGLKIDHMEIISPQQMRPEVLINDAIFKINFIQYADYFMSALLNNKIFVTKTDYAQSEITKNGNIIIPTWAFLLSGHGLINYSIAHLSLSQYKDFLNYMDTKLITKLFCVSSCYAAGQNEETVFADFDKPFASRTYSYAIIIEALTDSPTTRDIGFTLYVNSATKNLRFDIPLDLSAFVKSMRESDSINFAETMKHIMPEAEKPMYSPVFIANAPRVRLPGQPWFSLIDTNRRLGSIGGILAKTREQPLDVQKYFKNPDLSGILLYARVIPFDIIINSSRQFAIIPMLPASGFTIKKVSAQFMKLKDLFYAFAQTEKNLNEQKFYIGSMEGKDDIFPEHSDELKTIYNVLIDRSINENRRPIYTIYFTYNNKVYTASFTDRNIEIDSALNVSEISGDSARKYQNEKPALEEHIALLTPATHEGSQAAGIEKIKEVHKTQGKKNLAMYKSYLDLSKDPEFLKWREPYEKDAKDRNWNFDQLEKIISSWRADLIEEQKRLQKKVPKKNLSPDELKELAMLRKFNEYALLKRWYDALSTDEKKKLDEEVKKEAK